MLHKWIWISNALRLHAAAPATHKHRYIYVYIVCIYISRIYILLFIVWFCNLIFWRLFMVVAFCYSQFVHATPTSSSKIMQIEVDIYTVSCDQGPWTEDRAASGGVDDADCSNQFSGKVAVTLLLISIWHAPSTTHSLSLSLSFSWTCSATVSLSLSLFHSHSSTVSVDLVFSASAAAVAVVLVLVLVIAVAVVVSVGVVAAVFYILLYFNLHFSTVWRLSRPGCGAACGLRAWARHFRFRSETIAMRRR